MTFNLQVLSFRILFQQTAAMKNSLKNILNNSVDKTVERQEAIAYGTADHGCFLSVPDGLCVEKPFKVTVRLTGVNNFVPLILITEIGNNSNAKVILELKSDQTKNRPCFHPVTHAGKIGNNSELELVEIQELGPSCFFFPNETIEIGENAVLTGLFWIKAAK